MTKRANRATPARLPSATRAALYTRVSTREQAERWGLPAQRKVLNKMALEHGWNATTYDEGGASAETIAARPVLQRLLADVKAGLIDIVAVAEMERLCRASDLRDWAEISTTFREAGVPVQTPERVFNLHTAEDDFEADLKGILSKREKRKLLERTKRGLDEAKDAGRFAGGRAPYGYRYDREAKNLVVEPKEAEIVKRVFDSDLSPWTLARTLKEEGVSLIYSKISRIRVSPVYLGLRKDSQGNLIEAAWPAIVTQEQFDRWKHRKPKPRVKRKGPKYLLTGIVKCKNCGGPVVGTPIKRAKSGARLYVYKCYYRSECPKKGGQLTGWLVDLLVMKALQEYAGDPEKLKARYAEALDQIQGGLVAERRSQLLATLKNLEARQERLLDAVEQGIIPDGTAKKRARENAEAIGEATRQLDDLNESESIPTLPDLRRTLELAARLPELPLPVGHELLTRLAYKVTLDPRERTVLVAWKLGSHASLQIPMMRGGPGRSYEAFIEATGQTLESFRIYGVAQV